MKSVLRSILIAAGMVFLFLAAGSPLFPGPANQSGNQSFTGYLILQEEGKFRVEKEEYVKFQVVDGEVRGLRIHLRAASGDLTFNDCYALVKDGSNFTDWFQIECRKLGGFGGKAVTYESYLAGAYAGISPPVVPAYSMYETLKKIAGSLGLPVPGRTFVIYGQNRSPIYEFFCYEDGAK
ncbi:MAG: hypothetical protein HPY46_01510 [Candidatus Aminicenantes bacterium]|uniref:Uncharacterized protein n=1 Tax=Candidatus Saccharicenans subterraneus TaxID=2508984 RepID=A0A3E2BIU6_9BACT|nr:hypothetical protein [Candidatus Aminicenantes bacterium]RFT14673.1 MAG: hypothetical protein OP8BY_2499 [Candidatus Saccharicenans subterraneum]